MALELTDQESVIVRQKRKDLENLPTYYNAALRTDVQISRDFEAFLILSPREMKEAAVAWIDSATGLQKTNSARDQLAQLGAAQELLNSTRKLSSYDEVLGKFEKFRTTFQATTRFAEIPEVQQFLFDLQRVIEELAAGRDRAQFDGITSQVLQRANDRTQISPDQIEELQSWVGVLKDY